MNIRPIEDLRKEHQGHVVLLNIREFADCKGMVGRPWSADEESGKFGSSDPDEIRCFFTHFVELSEIEAAERQAMTKRYGILTPAENLMLAEKYGHAHQTSES